MSEDAEENLQNYKLQLQQVDAALQLDKDNAELLTLKTELEEIIGLTLQLLGKDEDDSETTDTFGWKVGDQCLALWPKDKQYYAGVLSDISKDGSCTVKFAHTQDSAQCQVSLLKQPAAPETGAAASLTAQGSNQQAAKKRRREERAKAQDLKAKKVAKKQEKEKEMEAVVEQEKRSWQNFSKKMGKQKKIGKSIFATPDPENATGRVGVGTCGIAGKGMTPFAAPQYKPQGHHHAGPASQLPKV